MTTVEENSELSKILQENLKEREQFKKEGKLRSKEELDSLQKQQFLNVNKNFGSMGNFVKNKE
ncbi:hypothetical protein AGENTSMITH_184 [Bacillus phage vB_BspM_AgentSmith]|nr:hypothetical protein AGENTSMITH_184 [Bacillus phage vB_BspM_AgentSmith]